jgi:EamA domain-containing membrane protein RarD
MVLAGDIAMWLTVLCSWGFVITYMVTAPWWKSEMGLHLWSFSAVIGVLFTWIAYRWFFRTVDPPEATTRFVIYAITAFYMGWRWSILIRAQRKGRRAERVAKDAL